MIKGLCFEQTHCSPTALASRYPPFVPLVVQNALQDFADLCVKYSIKHIQPCACQCVLETLLYCWLHKRKLLFVICGIFSSSLLLPHVLIESFIRDGNCWFLYMCIYIFLGLWVGWLSR